MWNQVAESTAIIRVGRFFYITFKEGENKLTTTNFLLLRQKT